MVIHDVFRAKHNMKFLFRSDIQQQHKTHNTNNKYMLSPSGRLLSANI